MSTEHHPPQAVLHLPRPTTLLLTYAKKVSAAMDGNPHFPSPVPSLAKLNASIAALDDAETAMGGGVVKTKKRDADRLVVTQGLYCERQYVQTIADQQTSLADAETVIVSAGMFVRKMPKTQKAPLAVRPGMVSGTAVIIAAAVAPTAMYYWQWTTGANAWTSLPETIAARTSVQGLTPATIHAFRFRALTRTGLMEWSQPVSLLVP
ncbi:MAG: hypothetical protein U0359_16685 [Byssovorax sp.]